MMSVFHDYHGKQRATMTNYSSVLYDVAGHVATITLNRPTRRNAWTIGLSLDIARALAQSQADDNVRAVVITGAGDTFSVGADLEGGNLRNPGGDQPDTADWTDPHAWPQTIDKPVIAALNGDTVGGGISFSMLCDLRVVADSAKIGFVFARRGVVAEMTAHWSLPRAVGFAVAQDLLLTARVFRGTEAVTLGVCQRAMPAADVLPYAQNLAKEIATTCAPTSLAISKRLLWEDFNAKFDARSKRETALLEWCVDEGEATEGVASFLEKRAPQWTQTVDRLPSALI